MADTPRVKVEIAFGANASMGDWFLLDDPVRGLLDDVTGLGPDSVWVDVTDTVLGNKGLSCKRGRERYSDDPQGGVAQFTLNNRDRRYDPLVEVIPGEDAYGDVYTDVYLGEPAPYAGQLVPMRRVRISAVWPDGTSRHVWAGYVDQWPIDYSSAHSEVTVPCVDAFAVLAGAELAETAPSDAGDLPWERMHRALSDAKFPPTFELDDGVEVLAATTYGENALSFVKRTALSDAGRLFVTAEGTLRFRDRTNIQPTAAVVLGGEIPVQHVQVDTSADQLWNRMQVELEDGTVVTADDTTSQADFMTRTRTFQNLMLSSAERADAFAELMLGRYANPRPRVSSVSVRLAALTAAQQQTVLGLDIGDLVQVQFEPFSGGYQAENLFDGVVEGVSVAVGAGRDWTVTVSVSATDTAPYLRLDDPFFGQLDENVVAF